MTSSWFCCIKLIVAVPPTKTTEEQQHACCNTGASERACLQGWSRSVVVERRVLFTRHVKGPSLYNYLGDGQAARLEHEQFTIWQKVWRL